MRIEQFQPSSVKSGEAGPAVEKWAETEAHNASGQRPDQADLSRLSRIVTGEVDQEARLEKLHLEVAAGAYQAPAAEVSRRIVDFHLRTED